MRAPSARRQPIEIAADIVEVLRADDSVTKRIAAMLQSMSPALRELHQVKKLSVFKKRVEKERNRLEELREEYFWLGAGLRPLDEAVLNLSRLKQMWGPRTQANPLIKPCVIMADDMIRRHSRNKRLDYDRLGTVAGYVYEAVTGIRGNMFRRACQEFIAERRTSLGKK